MGILPNLSKIYEELMYQQLYEHFNSIIAPKQCEFRKGYSAQRCLMVTLEKFKNGETKEKNLRLFSLTFLKHSIA